MKRKLKHKKSEEELKVQWKKEYKFKKEKISIDQTQLAIQNMAALLYQTPQKKDHKGKENISDITTTPYKIPDELFCGKRETPLHLLTEKESSEKKVDLKQILDFCFHDLIQKHKSQDQDFFHDPLFDQEDIVEQIMSQYSPTPNSSLPNSQNKKYGNPIGISDTTSSTFNQQTNSTITKTPPTDDDDLFLDPDLELILSQCDLDF